MPRYQEMYLVAKEELDKLHKERAVIDRLAMKLLAFEAAIKVLARHELIVEFADELSSMETAPVSNGDRASG